MYYDHNKPNIFIITPENMLETLMEWMPDQLHDMRLYMKRAIVATTGGAISSIQCQYLQTVGGERFRLVNVGPSGDSASAYYKPLGTDDDIILAYALRLEKEFAFIVQKNRLLERNNPIEITLKFE